MFLGFSEFLEFPEIADEGFLGVESLEFSEMAEGISWVFRISWVFQDAETVSWVFRVSRIFRDCGMRFFCFLNFSGMLLLMLLLGNIARRRSTRFHLSLRSWTRIHAAPRVFTPLDAIGCDVTRIHAARR